MKYLLGVDTGGTFTDFVVMAMGDNNQTIRIHKCLSTPSAPELSILQGIDDLGLTAAAQQGDVVIVHGSTVATNAALEGKGVRTLFITNRGFKDMLTLGRQTRRELYNLQPTAITAPVPKELCLETGGRLSASGELIDALSEQDLNALRLAIDRLKPQSVAINLLFSFLDDRYEKIIESIVPDHIFATRSSFVLPEYKEYERGMATWLNAWLSPLVENYLQQLKQTLSPSPVAVMQSSGGTIDADQASSRAVNMLLSGPAGGLAAARYIGDLIDSKQLLTFDMGGTSTDVALIDGDIRLTNEGRIGDYPVAVPMVDMHTIGAGGGSIASIDSGAVLQVGPESAGADPGPACYGLGGQHPTVTDANVVLGRLRPDSFLGGEMSLDIDAARSALSSIATPMNMSIEQAAEGVLTIANEHMTRALRVISVQRGYDPAHFRLCSFGGAGGLHVCALADNLQMSTAVIPVNGGVLSALGMLVAPRERQLSRSHAGLLDKIPAVKIGHIVQQLIDSGRQELIAEGVSEELIQVSASLDLRYMGQSFTLTTPWTNHPDTSEAFHLAHLQRYGHQMALAIEMVNVRVSLKAYTETISLPRQPMQTSSPKPVEQAVLVGFKHRVPVYDRSSLHPGTSIHGPALITERVSTSLITTNWSCNVDCYGNLLLNR
ncbi:MAG: hydantoinase/oxoprolinase family protein [Oceanicoccus sp.]